MPEQPVTLDPTYLVPADGPLGMGQDRSDAQAVSDASAQYATDVFELDLTIDGLNVEAHACLNESDAIEFGQVTYDWGDGTEQPGVNPDETHAYATAGSYLITTRLTRDGLPSLERSAYVALEEPPPPPDPEETT